MFKNLEDFYYKIRICSIYYVMDEIGRQTYVHIQIFHRVELRSIESNQGNMWVHGIFTTNKNKAAVFFGNLVL